MTVDSTEAEPAVAVPDSRLAHTPLAVLSLLACGALAGGSFAGTKGMLVAVAVLQALVFQTASADPDHEIKPGAKFTITFVSDQPGGVQLAANAWPANVRFRSKTDRLLDGTDDKDLTTYEIVNRGTPQAPIFDVLRVSRGTRT